MSVKSNTHEGSPVAPMNVLKRNGTLEPVNLEKILLAIGRCAEGISDVDPSRVAAKTIGGLYDGATTLELDRLSIQTACSLIPEGPGYSKLASRLLAEVIRKEVIHQDIHSFSQGIAVGHGLGLISDTLAEFVKRHARKLDQAINDQYNNLFEYFGLRSVYEGFLLRNPATNQVIETPQYFFLRVAAAQASTVKEAIKLYREIAKKGHAPAASPGWVKAGLKITPGPTELSESDEVVPFRPLMPGMGQAVAERTILRRKENGEWETWGDVANRVALGNASLASTPLHPSDEEYKLLRRHIANGNTLMSGRHLQHGDHLQPTRNRGEHYLCRASLLSSSAADNQ